MEKLPGHWLLARLGKRVLRPGGRELTDRLIRGLAIEPDEPVVEFAPGLGETARLVVETLGARYTGVERDPTAAARLQRQFGGHARARFLNASAEETGLPDSSASAVWGEAMLTMQSETRKRAILREAERLLRPGGRFGIHELCLTPDSLPDSLRSAIERELSMEIHVGVHPGTVAEWRQLLEEHGFTVRQEFRAPMHLLEPKRMLADERLAGAFRICVNLLLDETARRRVLAMRRLFRKYNRHLEAVALIGRKP